MNSEAQRTEIARLLCALDEARVALRREFYVVAGGSPTKAERRQIKNAVERTLDFFRRAHAASLDEAKAIAGRDDDEPTSRKMVFMSSNLGCLNCGVSGFGMSLIEDTARPLILDMAVSEKFVVKPVGARGRSAFCLACGEKAETLPIPSDRWW